MLFTRKIWTTLSLLVIVAMVLAACGTKEVEVTKIIKETVVETVVEEEVVVVNKPPETPDIIFRDGLPPYKLPVKDMMNSVTIYEECIPQVEERLADMLVVIPEELEEYFPGFYIPEYICETGSWGIDDLGDSFEDLWEAADDPLECSAASLTVVAVCGAEVAACLLSLEGESSPPPTFEICVTDDYGKETCGPKEDFDFPGGVCIAELIAMVKEKDPCVASVKWFADACGLTDDE